MSTSYDRRDRCSTANAQRSIGHSVAASSRPMAMLNHFSRTGSDRKPRSAMPKPAQVETLKRWILQGARYEPH